jgi:hypothetical protein
MIFVDFVMIFGTNRTVSGIIHEQTSSCYHYQRQMLPVSFWIVCGYCCPADNEELCIAVDARRTKNSSGRGCYEGNRFKKRSHEEKSILNQK